MRDQPTTVIVGSDASVAEWVRRRLPEPIDSWGGLWAAIGVARGDELIAGWVFNNFNRATIEVSLVAADPSWCSRRNLVAFFYYPFRQLGVSRLGATVAADNEHARRFTERLGFRAEGRLQRALPGNREALIFGMTPEECRWLS